MITITYKDKTYKMQEPFPWFEGTIDVWLENGTLEEVKENKELMDDETLEAIKEFEEHKKSVDDPSILEKLRGELEMRITHWSSVPVKQNCYKDILDLLISLETKEEPEKTEEMWQPKKGDIIEVSHDKKYWHTKAFKQRDGAFFVCHNDISPKHIDKWLFARPLPLQENKLPLPQEDIELPDFDYETCSDWKMGLQVELLTDRLNQLIKANKKLGK